MPAITAVATSFEELASAVSLAAEKNLHLTIKEERDEANDSVIYHLKSETNASRKIRNLFSSETGKSHDRQVKNAFLVFTNKLKADDGLDIKARLSLAVFEDALRKTHTNDLHGSRSVVWSGLLKEAFDDRDVKIPTSTKTTASKSFAETVTTPTTKDSSNSDTAHDYDIPVVAYEIPVSSNSDIEPYAVVHASDLDETPIVPPRDPKLPPQNYLEPDAVTPQQYLEPEAVTPQVYEEPVASTAAHTSTSPVEPYAVVDITGQVDNA